MITYLELHGRILFVLWCGVALVVEVVRGGGVNHGGFLGRLVETLTVYVDEEGQQPSPKETGNPRGNEVDGGECWETKKTQAVIIVQFNLTTEISIHHFVPCLRKI